jgi:hypothetical protein
LVSEVGVGIIAAGVAKLRIGIWLNYLSHLCLFYTHTSSFSVIAFLVPCGPVHWAFAITWHLLSILYHYSFHILIFYRIPQPNSSKLESFNGGMPVAILPLYNRGFFCNSNFPRESTCTDQNWQEKFCFPQTQFNVTLMKGIKSSNKVFTNVYFAYSWCWEIFVLCSIIKTFDH